MKSVQRIHIAFESLRGQITPVMGYALVVLMCVLLFLLCEFLARLGARVESQVVDMRAEFQRIEQIQQTTIWENRFAESKNIRLELEGRLWTASTSGVVAAQLQQVIEKMAMENAVENIRIEISPNASDLNGVDVMEYEFSGTAPPGEKVIELFADFASEKRVVVITRAEASFSIRDRLATRFKVAGVIPVLLDSK